MPHPPNDTEQNPDTLAAIKRLFPRVRDFYECYQLRMSPPTFDRAMNMANYVSQETRDGFEDAFTTLELDLGKDAQHIWLLKYRSPETFYQLFKELSTTELDKWQKVQDEMQIQIRIQNILDKKRKWYKDTPSAKMARFQNIGMNYKAQ